MSVTPIRATLAPTEFADHSQPDWLDRRLFPFKSRYVNIDDHKIHYIDEGEGPVILFLHGAPAWSFLYRNIIPGLKNRFRCIAFDFPGFGLSTAAPGYKISIPGASSLIDAFIDALELNDLTLYLHDASASMALGALTRRPHLFRALIVSNAFGFPLESDFPSIVRFLKAVRSKPFGLLIRRFNFLTRYFVRGVADGRLTSAERAAYLGPTRDGSRRRHQQEMLASILDANDYLVETERRLAKINEIPTLFAFGDQDAAYKAGFLPRFQATLPNHQVLIVEGGNHFPQEDDPEAIVNAIHAWWDSLVGRS